MVRFRLVEDAMRDGVEETRRSTSAWPDGVFPGLIIQIYAYFSESCGKSLFLQAMRLKPPKIIRRLMPDLIWEIDDEDGDLPF